MNKRQRGAASEDTAVEYLLKKGYSILRRNYRYERGEIDVIAQHGEILVFVEVKARHTDAYGAPIDAVTEAKQKQIRKVAEGYLLEHEIEDTSCRFDVIGIQFNEGIPVIEHIEDAF